jgi:hypothetical protein
MSRRLPSLPSQLPAEDAYWDALATRILDSAGPLLVQQSAWWAPPAWVSNSLLAGAVVGIGAAVALVQVPANRPDTEPASVLERAIAPQDPLAARVLFGQAEPSIVHLLPEVMDGELP